jgi:hypothetical protein
MIVPFVQHLAARIRTAGPRTSALGTTLGTPLFGPAMFLRSRNLPALNEKQSRTTQQGQSRCFVHKTKSGSKR